MPGVGVGIYIGVLYYMFNSIGNSVSLFSGGFSVRDREPITYMGNFSHQPGQDFAFIKWIANLRNL